MLLMLLLAEMTAQPSDAMTIRKSMVNMARCVQDQIGQLDDGLSDARTIARASLTSCRGARGVVRKSWEKAIDELSVKYAKKTGEIVTEAEKEANVEQEMSAFDESLRANSIRWVLQKRAGNSEAARIGEPEPANTADDAKP